MPTFTIEVAQDAKEDLSSYTAFERKMIVTQIRSQLSSEPAVETRNRKALRDNPLAKWELRIGRYRVFYEIDEAGLIVRILAVGHKEHNVLWIKGKEVQL
jgi:mRNA-degrading endonuclease RelE of RelBE toxin-antitoxin system